MSVERANDHNNGKPKSAVDSISNKPVWAIQGTDPSAKGKNTGQVVKMTADVQPVPPEAIPGTPFRPAVFEEMSAVPYVRDGWISYTLWAKEMRSALPAWADGPQTRARPAVHQPIRLGGLRHDQSSTPSSGHRKAIPATCGLHRGPIGFANLMVSQQGGLIVFDPHVTSACVIILDEEGAKTLRNLFTEWLG